MWTAATRAGQRLANAVGLLALLLGVPLAQLHYIGLPLPDHPPTLAELRTALTSRDWLTDATYLNGLSILLWLLWLLFAVSVAIEIWATVRGVRAPRYRLLAPAQGLAAALIAGITTSIVVAAPAASLTASFTNPPAHASPAAAVVIQADANPRSPAASSGERLDGSGTTAPVLKPVGTVTLLIDGKKVDHTVTRGDSLWRIADEYLGDGNRWTEIWELNKGRYWPHISGRTTFSNPDLIFPGWVLTMPSSAPSTTPSQESPASQKPPGGPSVPPTTGPTTAPSTSPPAPSTSPPAPSASATASPATPTSPPAPGDDGVFVPPSATVPISPPASSASPSASTATSSPSTFHDTAPESDDDESSTASPDWVAITGGAMGVGLATGLIYAAALVWKRRRHQYRPTPITSPVLRDPDLTPPLGALTRLRQGVRRAAPHLLDRKPDRGPTVREYVTADVKPPLPPTGPSGADLAGVGALPVTAGLGLDGPAALDAARALLVATLTSGDADDPHAQGRVIIPASTLATLLGVAAVDLNPMHRLTVAPTFAAALALLEEEIIRRSRIVADQEIASVHALRQEWTFGEPLPQLLLIADVPDQTWHTRLATAIRIGTNLDIGTTLIGVWPEGTTLTGAADGTTTGSDGERVAVLDTAATTDILTMLAESHGDAQPPTRPRPTTTGRRPATTAAAAGRSTETENSAPAPAPADPPHPDPGTLADEAEPPQDPGPPVHARVLGEPAILGTDGKPVRGLRSKSLELFVYLAVHRSGAALDDIMEALWPDVTVSRAGDRLSTCVANLRSTIRSIAQADTEPADDAPKIEPVINTGGHYHLDPTLLQVDWWTVQDAYARVATASDDHARLTHLHTAIAAAKGGLADGSDYEWIDTDREHARRHLVKIYAHAAGLQADTDPAAALTLYDTARALDPLSDELTRRAMRTAARLGDAPGVRERLRLLRRELDDAGIDIDPDTEELATSLLRDLANP
ncbi:LysM domain-containing protein [Micromonospora sp. Llam0]|uniref:LysM peptidoglycan-binding domain-containing protein n=1 Tax=Micromonospora sp. Llam0 TaxID=2485143 RepID=UPI000F483B8B|nr:LysM peptidoglycan-binding domain-containing protein [Micromonospora sp. Llam0]ROO60364.1 LysM domain-containing protein [Micromonospora sp. Llam0]